MAFNNTDTYPENTTDTLLDQRMRPNCSVGVNGTIHASCRTRSRPPVEDGQKAFLVILVILIVVANTAVLVAIYLSKNKTRMNFFIMQLAIADLLVGLFHVTSDLGQKYSIEWIGGDVTCKLVQFLKVLVSYASTFVLVSLSIDRLDAIARPLNFSRSAIEDSYIPCLVISFVFSLPQFFLYKGYTYWSISVCGMTLTKTWQIKLYFILSAVAIFIVPAVIVTMCYIVIVYVVWSKSKALTPQTERSTKTSSKGWSIRKLQNGSSNGTASTKTSSSSSNRGVIPQAKIRTIKMTLVIVIAFIVCWAPYFVYNFLDVFGYTSNVKVSIFVQSLSSFNSAANPLIYGLFSSRICRNLRRIKACNWFIDTFCCCCDTLKVDTKRNTSMYNSSLGYHGSSTMYTSAGDQEGRRSMRGQDSNRRITRDDSLEQRSTLLMKPINEGADEGRREFEDIKLDNENATVV